MSYDQESQSQRDAREHKLHTAGWTLLCLLAAAIVVVVGVVSAFADTYTFNPPVTTVTTTCTNCTPSITTNRFTGPIPQFTGTTGVLINVTLNYVPPLILTNAVLVFSSVSAPPWSAEAILKVGTNRITSGIKCVFDVDTTNAWHTENLSPYSLFAKSSGVINKGNLGSGTHRITANFLNSTTGVKLASVTNNIVVVLGSPSAPYNLVGSALSPSQLLWKWSYTNNANKTTSFRLETAPTATGLWTTAFTFATNQNNVIQSGLASNTTVFARVIATN